jgi:hypothetical protein
MPISPTPAFVDLPTAVQIFQADPTRIIAPIGASIAANVPYLSVLPQKTYEAQVSPIHVSVVQGRTVPGTSMTFPVFNIAGTISSIGTNAGNSLSGTLAFQYQRKLYQDFSDVIALNVAYDAFKESLTSQLMAVQQYSTELINADTRAEIFTRSGVKAIVQSTASFYSTISGGQNQIDTALPNIYSDSRLTFELLHHYCRYLTQDLLAWKFGNGEEAHLRFIGSADILESLRNDLGAAAGPGGYVTGAYGGLGPLPSAAISGDKDSKTALHSYLFKPLYRGIDFGEDQRPLRYNWGGAPGAYTAVEPYINVAGSTGNVEVVNPGWLQASHEVGFLFARNSFERQVPAKWVGEGRIKWAQQMFGGEVIFGAYPDMVQNFFKNYGVLAFQISRAFRPIYPWHLLPILYKRCVENDSVAPCTGVSS